MKLALMVITDGRDYVWDMMESLEENFDLSAFEYKIIMNDCQDKDFQERLAAKFPRFKIDNATTKRGFGGQIQAGWASIPPDVDYIFHVEDDFVFVQKPDLWDMIDVLGRHPYIIQMALLRGPANEAERKAGGLIELHPESYEEHCDGFSHWREHRRFFTTNPSLYRRSLIEYGWPSGPESEGRFGIERFAEDPNARAAFWGSFDSDVWVEHIGNERQGSGY